MSEKPSMQKDFHNKGGLLALLASIGFVFIFFFYIVYINSGIDLAENVTNPTVPGEIQFDLASVEKAWINSDDVVKAGAKLYKQNCALCHGANGDLVGGIANARNLVEGQWKMPGSVGHYKVLQNGIAGTQMVSFKAQLNPKERWALVQFIESITKNKSKDKPEDVEAFAQTAD